MKSYFDYKAKDFNPYQVLTIYPTELGIFGSHTFHELMIADSIRVNAFKQAINKANHDLPNSVWVDVGSGLCPLTLLAASSPESKKIYAIEQVESTINLARTIIDAQPKTLQNKIKLLHGLSHNINLPEKADILMTETLGNFGVEEGLISLLNDAKKRFLKQDAIIIPSEIEFIIAPIESARCYQRINFWKKKHYGLDFSNMAAHATTTVYHHRVLADELLGNPVKMGSIDLTGNVPITEKLSLQSTHSIQRKGTLHGFVGWFRAKLYKNIFLSNDPLKKRTPFSWTQAYFPLPLIDQKPVTVKSKQMVDFSIDWNLATNQLIWKHRL